MNTFGLLPLNINTSDLDDTMMHMQNIELVQEKKYITIRVQAEDYGIINIARKAYMYKVPVARIISFAWPRCPKCGGPLVQKPFTNRIVCAHCKAEFKLDETGAEGSETSTKE